MDFRTPARQTRPHPSVGPLSRTRVSIRPIDMSDVPGLSAFYQSLSPESLRRRFLGVRADPAAEAARACTWDRGLVAVLSEPGPRDGSIVGHAAIYPVGADRAEVAFAVADRFQGRGIGTALMRESMRRAVSLGVARLEATTFADNTAMRRMLHHAGGAVLRDAIGGGVEEIVIDVSRAAAPDERSPQRHLVPA